MNGNELTIISPRTLAEAKELSTTLAAARTLPEALQQKPADVLAIVMAGAELGLAPMQSIRGLVLIKGKPTLSADAMGALVKSRRDVCAWLRLVESTDRVATYETQRAGDPGPTKLSFTIEQAQRAGLNGDNWKRFPEAMLRARALSALCRAVYPDLLLGVYDPDELETAPVERPVNDAPAVVPPPRPSPVEAQVVDAPPPAAQVVQFPDAIGEWCARIEAANSVDVLKTVGSAMADDKDAKRLRENMRIRNTYTQRLAVLGAREAKGGGQ